MDKYTTALVTGGAGFIGSHIAEYLYRQKMKVIIVDNLMRGKVENISHLLDEGIEFVKMDVRNYDVIKDHFK
ncbi:MAG: SDR family NAD(P)-dependent oxidoreductase, partial [Candidatus Bathyarchaeota archaeon]|nr:SDR family NAD(P)-dependent oxidoreductase [Candidatus Bathyarchaeota archaeon]